MSNNLICTQNEIEDVAASLQKETTSNHCFLLFGDLGSGKTTFSKAFIRSFLSNSSKKVTSKEITSPTFGLVNKYSNNKQDLYHFDLYRLKNIAEIENIGAFDLIFNNLTIVEWPELLLEFNISEIQTTRIYFDFVKNDNKLRHINIV